MPCRSKNSADSTSFARESTWRAALVTRMLAPNCCCFGSSANVTDTSAVPSIFSEPCPIPSTEPGSPCAGARNTTPSATSPRDIRSICAPLSTSATIFVAGLPCQPTDTSARSRTGALCPAAATTNSFCDSIYSVAWLSVSLKSAARQSDGAST